MRDDKRPNGIIAGAPTSVSNYVRVTFRKPAIFAGSSLASMHVSIANPLAGGSAKSFLAPKFEAYFLLAAITSSTILDMCPSFRSAPGLKRSVFQDSLRVNSKVCRAADSSYQKAFTGGCFVLFRPPEGDVSRAASPGVRGVLRAPVTLAFGAA